MFYSFHFFFNLLSGIIHPLQASEFPELLNYTYELGQLLLSTDFEVENLKRLN